MGSDEFYDEAHPQARLLLNEQPKAEKRPDAWALMKECAGTRDLESDACRRFITATGLNGDEVARLADGLANPYGTDAAGNGRQEEHRAGNDRDNEGLRLAPR